MEEAYIKAAIIDLDERSIYNFADLQKLIKSKVPAGTSYENIKVEFKFDYGYDYCDHYLIIFYREYNEKNTNT